MTETMIAKSSQLLLVPVLTVFLAAPLAAQEELPTPEPEAGGDWDVETSLGFDRVIEFETDEGTWISADVSPDGDWIVFDLLGDIYRLRAAGGRAEPLSSGPAFDQQPRYSPDGGTIAFISDRGGADNVWLMDADGGNRRQLTEERETLPTSPNWTPDGEYIVVKRHVLDTRSLGGGEIWLYHVHGGGGVRLVEKHSFTSDINEPAVSADGRWVYYSHSGPFDYNRNVHQGIFQVSRIDRETGRIEPVTRSAGGAVRPLPSPDGASLAFVRRVGTNTVLIVRDLETGREREVFDGLDPDQMETWTVHGAFPAYSWTPDSRAVVLSSGGRLLRVEIATGETSPIPFSAQVALPVTQTARFQQLLGDDARLEARAIRWPAITPDGRRLVFQAVGRVWQMALPAGTPERVTSGTALEYAPAVSPDGRWIAFTTWDEAEGGALWRAQLRPGRQSAPERLIASAEQYANPSFSPDGGRIAFLRGSGRTARGHGLSSEHFLRVQVIDASGGTAHDVTTTPNRGSNRRMPRITWNAAGDRLSFQETREERTELSSIKLDGTDRRALATNEVAEEITASPDGRYVAFKELHNVYVAPLPRAGGDPIELSAQGSAMPVRQLSRWGGDWLAWSPDSRAVTWTLGPTVARQSLDAIYAPAGESLEGPEDSNLAVAGDQFDIRLVVPRARPEGTVALTGARIVTMRGDEVIENGAVLVRGNRIAAVGPADRVDVPAGAHVVDISGMTLIPGLVDVHAHMGYLALDINPRRPWEYYANLAYGVTTTYDPSASTQFVFSSSELVEAGEVVGPRVMSTGFILYGARNPNRAMINSLEDARSHLRRLRAEGAFGVKSYNQLRREVRQWVIQAAREEGMHVYPEGGSMLQQNLSMMVDGHTGIEHAIPVAPLYRDVVTLAAESGTGYTPTLVVGYGGIWGENYWYQVDDVFRNDRLLRFVPRGVLDARARRRMLIPEEEFWHPRLAAAAKDILRAGGSVQLGAHGQLQGLAAHWELWMMEQGGMTPLEALRVATLNGAEYLGLGHEIGSIEPGKLADLVVIDGDPLENLRETERVHMVMRNGFLYNENVDEVWPRQRARGEPGF